jgi:hypothetical protein
MTMGDFFKWLIDTHGAATVTVIFFVSTLFSIGMKR